MDNLTAPEQKEVNLDESSSRSLFMRILGRQSEGNLVR
jgi:hypothetical protein